MSCKLANPARRIAAPLSACILTLSGSGCAGLSFVGGLMTGPLPGGDSGRATPPPLHCMRNWSLAECQPGAGSAPVDGNQQRSVQAEARAPAPATPARGNRFSPPLGYCVRNWSLPECQNGTTPAVLADGNPQPAPDPAEGSAKKPEGLGVLIAVLALLGIAFVAANAITAAAMAGIP